MKQICRSLFAIGLVALGVACVPTTPTNQPPVAHASASPSSGTVPLLVSFSSAGSIDPDGTITAYSWTFGDGGTSTAPNPSHTYTTASTFTATLVVTDNSGATATATTNVTVTPIANQAPTAVAAATPTSGHAPLAVAFDASGSSDSDGLITSVEWDFGDGSPTSSAASPSHTYTAAGSYVALLTVTDNDGATNTDSVVIDVDPNTPPTASASATPTSGHAPLSVAFSSAGSSDPDGSITGYDWDFGDGSPHSSAASPSHTYTALGTIVATLVVTDNGGETDSTTVSVQVNANQPPTATATSDVSSGPAPLTVAFAGSTSVDNDGSIVSYAWNFGDGNTSSLADVSHTYPTAGTRTATLTVTDNDGATDVASIVITVGPPLNVPPSAAAGVTPVSGKVGASFAFSSAGSTDSDGSIVSYDWDFGDGSPHSSAPSPSHSYSSAATFTATLTVTDNDGATGSDTVQIAVVPNVPPSAHASGSPGSGKAPLTVNFTGSTSTDSDGTIASYSWNFGDGSPAGTSADPSHVYTTPGSYVAQLTVTDDNGATDTADVNVAVIANIAPTAVLNSDVTNGKAPLTVSFNSSSSVDPDGTIASRSLNFGDGSPTSSATTVSHVYSSPGTYTATLTVTDDNGSSATDTRTITVVANVPPSAAAQRSPASGNAPVTVSFTSTGSNDSDGTIVSYSWAFGDGGTGTGASTSHVYTLAGTFNAVLTVTDDNGATATATVSVQSIGSVLSPTSGPPGTTISVTMPCAPLSGHPPVATAIAALVTNPGGTVVVANSFDNSSSGNPNATVTLVVPPGTPAGSYNVTSSCDKYMTSVSYYPEPFTVT